jgi:hypothetical protein
LNLASSDKLDDFDFRAVLNESFLPIAFSHDRPVQFDRNTIRSHFQRIQQGRNCESGRHLFALPIYGDLYRFGLHLYISLPDYMNIPVDNLLTVRHARQLR